MIFLLLTPVAWRPWAAGHLLTLRLLMEWVTWSQGLGLATSLRRTPQEIWQQQLRWERTLPISQPRKLAWEIWQRHRQPAGRATLLRLQHWTELATWPQQDRLGPGTLPPG